MSCRRNYLLLILAMDMAKVGGPLSVVEGLYFPATCKHRVSARGWPPIGCPLPITLLFD